MENELAKIPTYDRLMDPLFKAIRALGGSGTIDEIYKKVVEINSIPDNILEIPHGKTALSEVQYRLAWARTCLKKYGVLENSSRGVWSITPAAKDLNEINSKEVVAYVRDLIVKDKAEKITGKKDREIGAEAEGMEQPEETQNWRDESSRKSSFYEKMVEHVFISEVLQEAWYRYKKAVEVLRSEVDSSGYDVVLECNGIVRYIQLKTSLADAKRANQNVNVALAEKPNGCVIWLFREKDPNTFRVILRYKFFGNGPGQPLPSLESYRIGKHSKGNAQGVKLERPSIRLVPRGAFSKVEDTNKLLKVLFGLDMGTDTL
jgi:hypothetical protein